MDICSNTGLLEKYKALVTGRRLDPGLDNYKDVLLNRQSLSVMILMNVQFAYILDFSDLSVPFISQGINDILGYDKRSVSFDDLVYYLIHPDERDHICEKNIKALEWAFNKKSLKPYERTFSINYRLKKFDGSYLKVMRQTSIHSTDKTGQIIHCFSLVSALSPISPNSDLSSYISPGIHSENSSLCLSEREIEILRLISDGKTSREIASKLFLSIYTIHNHRKNMLRKNDTKNASELINRAKESGLI